jgi:hypothetical protein
MTEHQRKIIEAYRAGLSLRDVARDNHISFQRVHFVITEYDPQILREPHRVPPRCRWPRVNVNEPDQTGNPQNDNGEDHGSPSR